MLHASVYYILINKNGCYAFMYLRRLRFVLIYG
jgi:hypothetical protein